MKQASLVVICAILLPSLARASNVPAPGNCTVPRSFTVCPTGDLYATLVIRDLANNPVSNAQVWVDVSACAGLALCRSCADDYVFDDVNGRLVKYADVNGILTFATCAGGVCGPDRRIYADGVRLHDSVPIVSPDQNGDLLVDASDIDLLQAKVGTTDMTGDLDSNGVVDDADVAMAMEHLGHGCGGPTPNRRGSWGRIKVMYR